jgi:hypothetical protein
VVYWVTVAVVLTCSVALDGVRWMGTAELHTVMEAIATVLALVVGVLALVRFYSHKNIPLLFVGTGFIGTGLLDGYHALVTSAFFSPFLPSGLPSLIPWSWIASRLFLSVMIWLSWLAWRWEAKPGARSREPGRHGCCKFFLID